MKKVHVIHLRIGANLYRRLAQAAEANASPIAREIRQRLIDSLDNIDDATLSVPEAGKRYFKLSRNGSYMAAARGDFPTVKIGRKIRVPVRAIEQLMRQS